MKKKTPVPFFLHLNFLFKSTIWQLHVIFDVIYLSHESYSMLAICLNTLKFNNIVNGVL